ncbi:GNAT family N-acetyltransferase [Planomonospora sp. ID91781]|uniref:Acetyltransferase n=1 Tax=Planomonospora sphaerica TaxID=161355 RepID=A0A171DPI4_9ACTN|nr:MULTISPECIES: GNAT family N-acetyltransferase [Planomonospora]MBG0824816.1 GNAT family N-acetyltransferase [Planomonospora sp. ID91781]GAT70960.1 acetyltransferase [Planomonospora sphaerica]
MSLTLRPMTESDWSEWISVDEEAFGNAFPAHRVELFRNNTEFDRSLGAFEGGRLVGVTAVCSFTMTVPGGPIPVGGVTAVGVLPSHRRRGVLTALMTRQLADLHERGEAVAALYASEAAIYGRFGYGRAADTLFFDIPTRGTALAPHAPADPALRLRIVRPAESREVFEKVFEAALDSRPGLYARTSARWDAVLSDHEADQNGAGPLRAVVAEDDGGPRGYALFRIKAGVTEHDEPDGELRLKELFGLDPAAYALLWRHLLERDLVARVKAWSRPSDDPLIHLLAEPRRLRAGWLDDLWVRIVDVERALPARRYAAPVDVVVEVEDTVCPWNAGRWRLTAGTGAARCAPTGEAADLVLPVTALGAAYLGGRSLTALQAAGVVREARAGAVRELSAALSWEPAPWAGLVF